MFDANRLRGLMAGIAVGNLLGFAMEGRAWRHILDVHTKGVRENVAESGHPQRAKHRFEIGEHEEGDDKESGRFLPGVPAAEVESILNAAPGDEIASGKFDNPESSAALAVNAFGFFLQRAADLPALPGCKEETWPARSLFIEAGLRFPFKGGRHPVLDCLVETPSALIGIESKRFEPYRSKCRPSSLSDAYWRPVWGEQMGGYERIRDGLRDHPERFDRLDAAQLFKHAFALRTEVHRNERRRVLKPILFYLYAEPEVWPKNGQKKGKAVDERAKARHRDEIETFSATVAGDEVRFVSCPWRRLLDGWASQPDSRIRAHAKAVAACFSP